MEGHIPSTLAFCDIKTEDILALGRWLHGTNYQLMFRGLPTEIIDRPKPQVETLKKPGRMESK